MKGIRCCRCWLLSGKIGKLKWLSSHLVKPFSVHVLQELSNLVGWFSYRRGSHHFLSMRERAVHNNLVAMVTHIPREYLLTLLITSQVNSSFSLHSEHHTLFCLNHDLLKGTPLTISNLHSTSSVVYRRAPSHLVGRGHVELLAQAHR